MVSCFCSQDFDFQEGPKSKKMKPDNDTGSDEGTLVVDTDPEDFYADAVPYTEPVAPPPSPSVDVREREACEHISFNMIQSIFVPCILNKVDELCREECYGCNLPIEKDFTQKNHHCLMMDQSEKVERFFDRAVDRILETDIDKCRSEWHLKAKENRRIVAQFKTVHARNRLFANYVVMHVEKKANEPENGRSVLYNICHF